MNKDVTIEDLVQTFCPHLLECKFHDYYVLKIGNVKLFITFHNIYNVLRVSLCLDKKHIMYFEKYKEKSDIKLLDLIRTNARRNHNLMNSYKIILNEYNIRNTNLYRALYA